MRKKGDWLQCPKCHKKTRVKVYDNTTLECVSKLIMT